MADTLPGLFLVAGLAALLGLSACARPVGDFGRAAPDVLHDEVMPAAGGLLARTNGAPPSRFDRTDEETEMANRLWRFETSGHMGDIWFDTAAELRRTGLAPAHPFGTDRYYNWLHGTSYQSSAVRYATIEADARADLATLPGAFAAICAVQAIDHERQAAVGVLPSMDQQTHGDVAARVAENDRMIGDFVVALRYRADSYGYALDHLIVETPSPVARDTDGILDQVTPQVRRAERRDFCGGASEAPRIGNPHPSPPVSSRFLHDDTAPRPAAAS